MKCSWCGQREAEFELAIYYLKEEKETVANRMDKQKQLLRNGIYLKTKLCEKCLPCTATTNPIRRKLFGGP